MSHLGIDPPKNLASQAKLRDVSADLKMLGFERKTPSWRYDYDDFDITYGRQAPKWVLKRYKNARDFGRHRTANPLSDKNLLLLSNSFGYWVAPHLAPAFDTVYHVNTNHIKKQEILPFLRMMLRRSEADELVFLLHDSALPNAFWRDLAEQLKASNQAITD